MVGTWEMFMSAKKKQFGVHTQRQVIMATFKEMNIIQFIKSAYN